jgi:HSP20 family protein
MNRSNPYEMMEELFERMSSEFEDLSRGMESPDGLPITGGRSLSMDVADRGDAYQVTVDVPGFDRDDVEVQATDDRLTVVAERDRETEQGEGTFIHRERTHRSLSRSMDLPSAVDEEGAEAALGNGVLTVTLPKLRVDDERSVDIDIE